jgi:hypothetical protein
MRKECLVAMANTRFSTIIPWRLNVSNVIDHPDLQQAQVEGLAAFYLLSVGQGIAIPMNLHDLDEQVT